MTRDGLDYALTDSLFGLSGFQDFHEAAFGRTICNYRPALKALVEVVGRKNEAFIRRFAKEFGYALSTLALETMEYEEIVDSMKKIVRQMESSAS